MRWVIFMGLCLSIVCARVSAAEPDKLTVLIQQYDSDLRDLHKLQANQAGLVKQKAAIDATGADLAKRQSDLNNQVAAHNAAVAAQQKAVRSNKKDCNDSDPNNNGSEHVNQCDNSISTLNSKSADLNSETLPMQTAQTSIDLSYSQYNQTANDWNLQEQQTMTAINTVYGSLNDWLDNADAMIGGQGFQDEMLVNHAEKDCPRHSLPANGSITVDQLMRYSGADDKCLKAVEALRRGTAPER